MTKRKVLVVDDNGTVLCAMKLMLENNGFEVTPAAGVVDALNWIARQPFDVLITDASHAESR
jgi:CheY-like chemotaxis protein